MQERNYGIDMLRLVLMYMVGVLHTLGRGGVLSACDPSGGGYKLYWLLEIISYCAVDGFALISGYMAKDRSQKYSKIVEMWFQVFFYSFVITMILTALGLNKGLSRGDKLKVIFPLTFDAYWYFTAYFALFCAMPLLNKALFALDVQKAKKTFVVLAVLFSFLGVISDPFKTDRGNSTLWLIVLYCMGVLAKKINLFEKKRAGVLVLLWAICTFGAWGIKMVTGIDRQISYTSPLILMNAFIMVILFSRIKLKGKWIAKLSPLAFGIYLLQLNRVSWNSILKGAFAFIAEKNLVVGVGYVFLIASGIFLAGLLVELIRVKIAKLLRIPDLSKKLASGAEKIVEKLVVLLR